MVLSKLKPLRNLGAFDGEKYKAELPRDIPLTTNCRHKYVKFVGSELRCSCGVSWTGPHLNQLYELFKNR